jgi:hypothetical protein
MFFGAIASLVPCLYPVLGGFKGVALSTISIPARRRSSRCFGITVIFHSLLLPVAIAV